MIVNNKKQTFSQGIFSLMVSQVIVKILGLFYRLYLTNHEGFGDEGNAIANGGFQVYAILLSIVAIGIPTAISKLVAENMGKGNYKGAYNVFKIALVLFATAGLIGSFALYWSSDFLANSYLHMEEARLSIIALCPSVFLVAVISVFKGFFSGIQSIKMTANAQSIDQLVKTISTIAMIELSIIFLKLNNTEIIATYSNLASTLGNLVELIYLYKEFIKRIPQIKKQIAYKKELENESIICTIKQILMVTIPLSLTALITTISKNIDSTTIINYLKEIIGYEEAKIQYGILSGKVDALVNFPLSFNMAIVTALLPSIAYDIGNIKSQERRIEQSLLLGLTIAFPITFLYFFLSDEILKFLFPNAFEGGIILKISSFQIILITIEQISNTILNGIGENTIPIKAVAVGVVIKGVLNRILVPKINFILGGTKGAAFATLVCHLVSCLISVISLAKVSNIKIKITKLLFPLITSVIMIFIDKYIFQLLVTEINEKVGLTISIMIGMILYLIISRLYLPIKFFNLNRKKIKTQLP